MASSKDYKALARQAKRLGFVSGEKWDLRRALTNGQKSYLTKLEANYRTVLKSPEEFFIRRVKKKTADIINKSGSGKVFKRASDNRRLVIVKKENAETLHIKRRKDEVIITKKSATRTTRARVHKDPFAIFDRLHGKKLPEGWSIGIRFEGKDIFQRFDSPRELEKYLKNFTAKQLNYMEEICFDDNDEEATCPKTTRRKSQR